MLESGQTMASDKVVSLEEYANDRFLADAIAWLDELGFAQLLAMGLEDHCRYVLRADLAPDVRLVLAKVLRATVLAAVKLTSLAVESQKRSGQALDWKAVAEMLEKELPAPETLTESCPSSTASDTAGSGSSGTRNAIPTPSADPGPRR